VLKEISQDNFMVWEHWSLHQGSRIPIIRYVFYFSNSTYFNVFYFSV